MVKSNFLETGERGRGVEVPFFAAMLCYGRPDVLRRLDYTTRHVRRLTLCFKRCSPLVY